VLIGKHYEKDLASGVVTKRYYAGSRLLASRTGTSLHYIQPDHLGSPMIITDPSGQVVARERYSAFGERRRGDEPKLTENLYTDQRFSSLVGFYHYSDGTSPGRFYDPLLARFLQADPLTPGGSQGLNRYAYVVNNPLVHIDPSGYCVDEAGNTTGGHGPTLDRFDCTLDEIRGLSLGRRRLWLAEMLSNFAGADYFNNIDDIIRFFSESSILRYNPWVSLADAAVLLAIQDGYRQATGKFAVGLSWPYTHDAPLDAPLAGGLWRSYGLPVNAWTAFFVGFSGSSVSQRRMAFWTAEGLGADFGRDMADHVLGSLHPLEPAGRIMRAFIELAHAFRPIAARPALAEQTARIFAGIVLGNYGCGKLDFKCRAELSELAEYLAQVAIDPTARGPHGYGPLYIAAGFIHAILAPGWP
jgi:RHS repeat-associated protein